MSVDATKSALNTGRLALRAVPCLELVQLHSDDKQVLEQYADYFNAHDFDAIRNTPSDEAKLDVVSLKRRSGSPAVSKYFNNYSTANDWMMVPGRVEHKPVMVMSEEQLRHAKTT